MKKIFLLLFIACLTTQIAQSAPQDTKIRNEAMSQMRYNNSEYYKKCFALANNFSYDSWFANHLRSSCSEFEAERERVLNIIYHKDYPIEQAALSAKMNQEKLDSYKDIITEYCKYNNSSIAKKDPEACTRAINMF